MVDALLRQIEEQNRRCDLCRNSTSVRVPTLLIAYSEKTAENGTQVLNPNTLMVIPRKHVICKLLHGRVNANGQCDEFE